jgi:hypothetical protein
LKPQYHKTDPAFKALEQENARLKKIIVNLRDIASKHVLGWCGIKSSSFYYKPSGTPKGINPCTYSMNQDGALFENAVVVADIEKTLRQEFCCYGYRNMTGELKEQGWVISHKKVYRLMKEHKLLYGGRIRPEPFKQDFIRFRTPGAERSLQYLSMDILGMCTSMAGEELFTCWRSWIFIVARC